MNRVYQIFQRLSSDANAHYINIVEDDKSWHFTLSCFNKDESKDESKDKKSIIRGDNPILKTFLPTADDNSISIQNTLLVKPLNLLKIVPSEGEEAFTNYPDTFTFTINSLTTIKITIQEDGFASISKHGIENLRFITY